MATVCRLAGRRRRLVLGATVAAGLASWTVGPVWAATPPSSPTAAATQGGISVSPAHYDPAVPASRSYFIPTIPAGGTYTDAVVAYNRGASPVDYFVDAVDGETGVTSGAVYLNRGDTDRAVASWVTVATPTITLQPHITTLVNFTVHVPPDATPGDHLTGIAFEPQHPATSNGSVNVITIIRSVVGMQIIVPGPAAFHLSISDPSIQPRAGTNTASVVVNVTDDGLKLGKPRLSITLDGPNGYHHTEPPDNCDKTKAMCGQLDTILPTDTIPFAYPWPEPLADGDYTISVTGTSDQNHDVVHVTGKYHLDRALRASIPNQQIVEVAVGSTLPWFVIPLVAVTMLLLVFLVIVLVVVPRLRREPSVDPQARREMVERLRRL